MWIRSQDRLKLINVNSLNVEINLGNLGEIDTYFIAGDNKYVLGEFNTEDQAIKVLDDIEKFIYLNNDTSKHSEGVYQIPLEGEIYKIKEKVN